MSLQNKINSAECQPNGLLRRLEPPQRLFIPGPTDVLPEVLEAQTAPMIGHRTDEFEALFAKVQTGMKQLYFTASRVYVVAATGSAMQEAAIRNIVRGHVINFINGAFSQRWHQVSVGCGKETIAVDLPWYTAVKPEQVAEALQKALETGPADAITVVHNETSTGVASPMDRTPPPVIPCPCNLQPVICNLP